MQNIRIIRTLTVFILFVCIVSINSNIVFSKEFLGVDDSDDIKLAKNILNYFDRNLIKPCQNKLMSELIDEGKTIEEIRKSFSLILYVGNKPLTDCFCNSIDIKSKEFMAQYNELLFKYPNWNGKILVTKTDKIELAAMEQIIEAFEQCPKGQVK